MLFLTVNHTTSHRICSLNMSEHTKLEEQVFWQILCYKVLPSFTNSSVILMPVGFSDFKFGVFHFIAKLLNLFAVEFVIYTLTYLKTSWKLACSRYLQKMLNCCKRGSINQFALITIRSDHYHHHISYSPPSYVEI